MNCCPNEKCTRKIDRNTLYCCVDKCGRFHVTLHCFPKDPTLRKKWQEALKITKKPSNYMRVCGHHFRPYDFFPGEKIKPRLKRNVIPSQNIPGGSQGDGPHQLQNEISTTSMGVPSESELTTKPEIIVPDVLEHTICKQEMISPADSDNVISKPELIVPEDPKHVICKQEIIIPEELEDVTCEPEIVAHLHIKQTVVENVELQENIEKAKHKNCLSEDSAIKRPKIPQDPLQLKKEDFPHPSTSIRNKDDHSQAFIATDENRDTNEPFKASTKDKSAGINVLPIHMMVKSPEVLCYYTGLHTFELLRSIVKCVSDTEVKSSTKTKLLCLKDRVLLAFITLKMNLDFGAVAPMFNISRYTCKRYFRTLVSQLATVFESAIASPTSEDIRIKIPLAFKNYTGTSVVTDCAKMPVERSQCPKCKLLTYSHNKKHHTVNFELGISASGLITSVTQCYQGKPSNKLIISESHALQKLDLEDEGLRDRGFFIENECLQRNIILHQPPFPIRMKSVSSAEETRKAKNAKTRMHAERIVEKIREFEMLNSTITWHLLPYIEKCLVIACGVVNLGNPVLSSGNFM